jgi:hypothetical protein
MIIDIEPASSWRSFFQCTRLARVTAIRNDLPWRRMTAGIV